MPLCLNSIKGLADEIVIVDTGSTDNTINVAKQFKAKIIQSEWQNDFSYSRNISIQNATSSWILWLDADDIIEEPSIKHILRLKQEIENPVTAFGFKVKNVSNSGMGDVFMQVRMFPNDKRLKFEWPIHEQIVLSLDKTGYRVVYLHEVEILHSGYHDNSLKQKKALRNRAILEKNMHLYESFPSYVAAYGDTFSMAEEWEKAVEVYKSVLDIKNCKNKHSEIYEFMFVTIALGYKHLNKMDEALKWVEKGLKENPSKIELSFLGGEISFDTGDTDRAFKFYKQTFEAKVVLATTPVDHAALKSKSLMRLGKTHQMKKEFREAESCFKKLSEMNNSFFDTPACLGEVYFEEGRLLESFKAFSDSVLRFPGADVRAYRYLGEICLHVGREDEAINFMEKGLSFFPLDSVLLDSLKTYYRKVNDTEKYLEYSRRLTESNRRNREGFLIKWSRQYLYA